MKKRISLVLLAAVMLLPSIALNDRNYSTEKYSLEYSYDKPIDPDRFVKLSYDKQIDPDLAIIAPVYTYDKPIDPDVSTLNYVYDLTIHSERLLVDPPIGPMITTNLG